MDPTGFPDPSGLQATTYAFSSWQVICNITKPKPKDARCSLTQPSTTTPPFFATLVLALALAKTSTPTHATPMLDSFSSLRTRSWYRLKTGRSRKKYGQRGNTWLSLRSFLVLTTVESV
ncbi:BnaC08g48280D [Brassica napus]|uniref:BnaC08g48280D protein n=2 Tax=Brassica TaxID=3705 RepID=A0A078JW24_BRANA|nr:BnaC08g48280D [Brassica napus]